MKKFIILIITIVYMAVMVVGCGAAPTAVKPADTTKPAVKSFSLYSTGSENVETMWKKIIPKFEAKYPQYKVQHVHVPSGATSNQAMTDKVYAAKQAGKDTEIDIFEGSLPDVVRGNTQGIWNKFTEAQVPNLKNVNEQYRKLSNDYAITHRASSVVLAYNSEKVPNPPKTEKELYDWIKNNPDKFAYNDPSTGGAGSSFVLTTVYNQLPAEALYKEDASIVKDWDKGFNLLKDLGKYVYGKGIYPKKNQGTLDLLISGEAWIVPAWSDMVLQQIGTKALPASTKMYQLEPALTGGPTYLMMSEASKNKEAAGAFLSYILEEEAQLMFINDMCGYPGIKWDKLPGDVYTRFKDVAKDYRVPQIGALEAELKKIWQEKVAAGN